MLVRIIPLRCDMYDNILTELIAVILFTTERTIWTYCKIDRITFTVLAVTVTVESWSERPLHSQVITLRRPKMLERMGHGQGIYTCWLQCKRRAQDLLQVFS